MTLAMNNQNVSKCRVTLALTRPTWLKLTIRSRSLYKLLFHLFQNSLGQGVGKTKSNILDKTFRIKMRQITPIIPAKPWSAEPQLGNITTFYAEPQLGNIATFCAKLGLSVPRNLNDHFRNRLTIVSKALWRDGSYTKIIDTHYIKITQFKFSTGADAA